MANGARAADATSTSTTTTAADGDDDDEGGGEIDGVYDEGPSGRINCSLRDLPEGDVVLERCLRALGGEACRLALPLGLRRGQPLCHANVRDIDLQNLGLARFR